MNKEDTRAYKQFIVCAAMRMKDGNIISGVRHFSPDMRNTINLIYGKGYHLLVEKQGFIDNMGLFLSREDAWIVAEKVNQIRYEVSSPGTLYSENLY